MRFSINGTSLPSASQKTACSHVVPPRKAAALEPSAVTLQGLPGHGRPLVHHAAAQRRQPLPSFRLRMSDNVSAVHEAPELTIRSAEEFPPPFTSYAFHNLRWQARASAPCVTPSLLSDADCTRLPRQSTDFSPGVAQSGMATGFSPIAEVN